MVRSAIFLFFAVFMLLQSCVSAPKSQQPRKPMEGETKEQISLLPTSIPEEDLPRSVAVLPFVNTTSDPMAAATVRRLFYGFFSVLNYIDAEPSLVDKTLKGHALFDPILVGSQVSPLVVGQALGVDAVIFGEVTSFGKTYALLYRQVAAGMHVRMVRCADGRVLWEKEHEVVSREGDVPLSLTGLAAGILKTLVDHSRAKVVNTAAMLCMETAQSIPDPKEVVPPPPRIDVFAHNGAGVLLRPGDVLRAVLVGEPGGQASWDLEPVFRAVPLIEKEPGVYVGGYTVPDDVRLPSGKPVGHLRTKNGVSSWSDVLGPLSLGHPTFLNGTVSSDTVLTKENSPYVIDTLIVEPGATLLLEEGVVALVSGLGLVVSGGLEVAGTRQQPVRLSGLGGQKWKGIIMNETSVSSLLSCCLVSDAEFGLRVVRSTVELDRCVFQKNTWGIVLDHATADLTNVLVRSSDKIGLSARGSKLSVERSFVSENGGGGMLLAQSQATIIESTLSLNRSWQLKAQDEKVMAEGNWWGTCDPSEKDILGPVDYQPTRKEPVAFLHIAEY